ncbi:clan AA aspartic protease, TIGR02281 family [Singulisphaera sp. GP187]|uniref:aspartyl protease family protein n=1 Tax=Singulisphaera sp. GP187 TaxID=1882752 RepID=UPI0009295650|nr:aspartyl protease family protein [Singulisphaera sp. GP187]SIO37009.1 clan AA aspartic protease, TIGR02281 family [Singulisphaera sp. GP187]
MEDRAGIVEMEMTAIHDAVMAPVTEPTQERIPPLCDIDSMESYLKNYGAILGRKAIHALTPLHVPGRDELLDFDDVLREPFPAQAHAITAAVKMLNTVGNGMIVGEMGTGKTIMGQLAAHKHACQSRRKGGSGGNYRAIVLCPDHLIGKWCREIEETIPDATISRFGPQGIDEDKPARRPRGAEKPESNSKATLRDVVALFGKSGGSRWRKPEGAEWFILGRNQAKWLSDWSGIADLDGGFRAIQGALTQIAETSLVGRDADGNPVTETLHVLPMPMPPTPKLHAVSSKNRVVDKSPVLNEFGQQTYDRLGRPITKNVTARVHYCPSCGQVVRDKKGVPVSEKDLTSKKNVTQKVCKGVFLQMLPAPADRKSHGLVRIALPAELASIANRPGHEVKHAGFKWVVRECKEPLYNYTTRPYRWSPARIIQKKCKRMFRYLLIDEVHEQKSDESAQSMACGKLIASVNHVIALTGTIIGGYANHLYPLMMRITPKSLRDEGFEWGKDMAFVERYGKIDRIVTTKEDDSSPSVKGNVKSMRRAKSGNATQRKAVRPGVMPTMFGRHMIGSSLFVTLDEMADELPDLFEYVGGPKPMPAGDVDGDHAERMVDGWFDCAVDMDLEQEDEYRRIMATLEFANRELLQRGSMKLLGTYLWTGLDYPDRPFGWEHDSEIKKAISQSSEGQAPGLLGQSFIRNFNHQFDAATETLVLTRVDSGEAETDRIPLKKDGGVYWLDVSFNGKTKSLVYDTGASSISISLAMAAEIGLKPRKGDEDVSCQVADGSIVSARKTTVASVKVGKFAVTNVECVVVPPSNLPHTVGYWDQPGIRTIDNFVGVVTPRDLPEDTIYPKEQRLIDICKKQKEDGRQTWVYVQMSGKRNIQPRLAKLLEAEGLKVGILRSDDVEPIEREEWIAKNGRNYDVMISHPQLVSTGLDLFSKKQGGHNYSTLVFYETGYNLFTMTQAARRAWRIGQPLDCRVYYLYYKDTMQHKAMQVISKKKAALDAINGDFSADGLAAMAGEDNLQMALAKNLSERINESDMQRSWNKVKSGPKKVKRPTTAIADITPKSAKPGPLDDLPIELQMAGESLVEAQAKPIPPEALAEFPKLHEKLSTHNHGFDAKSTNQEFEEHEADIEDAVDEEEGFGEYAWEPAAMDKPRDLGDTEPDEAESEFDTTFDDEVDDSDVPELTEEILAKMFANMMAHGLEV